VLGITERGYKAFALALMALATCVLPAEGQSALDTLAVRQRESRSDYEAVTREIALSQERLQGIAAEIEALQKDQQTMTAALIQAAKTERKLAQEADGIAIRIEDLRKQETALKASLAERRGVLAEVLGALQRMGLNPPPAILVKPEDALSSVRSAILLGAVVPELRGETEELASDLKELTNLSASIAAERDRLMQTVSEQVAEKERLTLLLKEKAALQARSEEVREAEQKKAGELAARAGSLRELIETLETEMEAVRLAEAQAQQQIEAARTAALEAENRSVPETSRMGEPVPFDKMVGKASLPVAGRIGSRFGEPDGAGGTLFGDMVTTQSGAIVTAPADGSVLYAGPFRSYGQLLILNAGGGYHIVLAGMGRINVSLGQSVLAGEPVGAMGEARLASAVSFGSENTAPQLYIELRKDGKPVDPAPWWAEDYSGRTGNDS